MENFIKNRKGTGTREWSEYSYNIMKGCPHNCIYCYAKADALYKYKSINNASEWTKVSVNMKKVNKKWDKLDGVIMFPTVHDITLDNINECITTLENILSASNDVLIVSKPCPETVLKMVKALDNYKRNILFRFTIGTTNNTILKLCEPGAPLFEDRLNALKIAYDAAFKTSVSIEPLLGGIKELDALYEKIISYTTGEIWVGKMNRIDDRVIIDSEELKNFIEYVKTEQVDDKILNIFTKYDGLKGITWKDSVKEVIKRYLD